MQSIELPLHELALIAATRGMAGAGVGLLVSGCLKEEQRKTAGWLLLGIGLLTTIPLAISVLRKLR